MARLFQAMGDEPRERSEILGIYLTQMVKNLEKLNAAIELGDAKSIDLIAHNCAGTSANCGIVALVKPLRELERMGRENRLDEAADLAAEISRKFQQVKLFVQENLAPVTV